jgi:hypothetical protein
MSSRMPRYFRNENTPSSRDAYKQLVASLTRLVTNYPPETIQPGGGLYYGPTSIAYLFFALDRLYPDITLAEYPLGYWSAAYLKEAEKSMKAYPGPTLNKCGIMDDIMAIVALSAASTQDKEMVRSLCEYSAIAGDPEAGTEWLYGRAGYLYLLRLVRRSFADTDDEEILELLQDAIDDVVDTVLEAARPWKWHNKPYVGAVHGAIGIITQVILTDPSRAPDLEADLGAVLSYQYDSGNWPSSLPPGRDRLVQFCHGAPGVVGSLVSIRKYFPNLKDRIDRAIARGRDCIQERGLLTKEPCLCHGITGNALALDEEMFQHFLTFTTGHEVKAMEKDGMLEKSDDPSGLWTGEAGRAWSWAVADKGLEKTFLGYNDL